MGIPDKAVDTELPNSDESSSPVEETTPPQVEAALHQVYEIFINNAWPKFNYDKIWDRPKIEGQLFFKSVKVMKDKNKKQNKQVEELSQIKGDQKSMQLNAMWNSSVESGSEKKIISVIIDKIWMKTVG